MSIFEIKTCSKPKRTKTMYEDRKKQSDENVIKSTRNLFNLKQESWILASMLLTYVIKQVKKFKHSQELSHIYPKHKDDF